MGKKCRHGELLKLGLSAILAPFLLLIIIQILIKIGFEITNSLDHLLKCINVTWNLPILFVIEPQNIKSGDFLYYYLTTLGIELTATIAWYLRLLDQKSKIDKDWLMLSLILPKLIQELELNLDAMKKDYGKNTNTLEKILNEKTEFRIKNFTKHLSNNEWNENQNKLENLEIEEVKKVFISLGKVYVKVNELKKVDNINELKNIADYKKLSNDIQSILNDMNNLIAKNIL